MIREIVVKELSPSLRDDFLLFFDHVAFADNPDWSDCYCSAYHFANKGKAESRREASSLIEEGRMHGFLAYDIESRKDFRAMFSRMFDRSLHPQFSRPNFTLS